MRVARQGGGWKCWVPFAALCLIASIRWLLAARWPQTESTLRSEACAAGLSALAALAAALLRRRGFPGWRQVLGLLAVGMGLLAAPSFGAVLHGAASEGVIRTVGLCFVPVMISVLGGVWGEEAMAMDGLWAGLAGLGGALLVFPLVLPSSVLGYAGVLLPVLAVSAACVGCRKAARGVPAEWSAALLLAGGAVGLALLAGAGNRLWEPVPVAAVALDVLIAVLAVVVVLRAGAVRYGTRYFAVPVLLVAQGMVLLHEGLTLRVEAGVVLLAVATLALWRRRTEAGTSMLDLR